MNNRLLLAGLAALSIVLTGAGAQPAPVVDPVPVAPSGARELFNGKDLANFYTFLRGRGRNVDPKGVFTVTNGVIHVTGEEMGCLTTEEAFRDYRLTVEYRWLGTAFGGKKDKAPDSGILFHSTGPDGGFGGIWMKSLEYNLILGASGDFWTVGSKERPDIYLKAEVGTEKLGGRYYIHAQGGEEKMLIANDRVCRLDIARDWTDTPDVRPAWNERPVGEWNTAVLVCRGDAVECWFNGRLVNRATHVNPAGGRIQLQSELCGVEFRRVAIEPCGPVPPPPARLAPVADAEVGVVVDGALAFNDRAFALTSECVKRLEGRNFLVRSIDGGQPVEVVSDGELLVVTPTAKAGGHLSQGAKLAAMGFEKMPGEPFLAFGKNACDVADVWRRDVKKGERVDLGKWAIVCGFDEAGQQAATAEERAKQAAVLAKLKGTPSEREDPRGILVNRPDYVVFVPKQPRDKALRDPAKPGDTYNDHFQVISNPSNGMLYAFWTQASREADIDQHIAFSRSADKGRTWADPVILAGSPSKRNPALLASWQQPMLSKSGRLYCLWNQQTTSRGPHCGLMFGAYSDDDGLTWSAPKLVPFTERMDADPADPLVPPSWCNWQRPLRLGENGNYFVGCSRHGKAPYDERHGCKIEFWEFLNIDANPQVQDIRLRYLSTNRAALSAKNLEKTGGFVANEPALEEAAPVKLPDGRLFALMRSSVGSPVWVQSRDGGRTWSEPKILKDADGKPYLHPRSPCPMYDWKGPEAGSGKYFALVHQTFDFNEPKRNAYQHRGPLYLIAGEFDPDGEQPVKFKAPKLFAPRKGGNSFYTSYCVVDGKGVLWYNDMKFYLCGRVVGPEWFE